MPTVVIPGDRIVDRATFHTVFAEALSFPDYYGRNMDAWLECMSGLDDPAVYDSPLAPGEVMTLHIEDAKPFAERCPDEYKELVECSALVNFQRISIGRQPIVALSFRV